jgi:hypothetical protein
MPFKNCAVFLYVLAVATLKMEFVDFEFQIVLV